MCLQLLDLLIFLDTKPMNMRVGPRQALLKVEFRGPYAGHLHSRQTNYLYYLSCTSKNIDPILLFPHFV